MNIDNALRLGQGLRNAYTLTLTPEQIDKAIEKEESLNSLYMNQKLPPEQITNALEIGKDLDSLYKNQTLNAKQIVKAIETGIALESLKEQPIYKQIHMQVVAKAADVYRTAKQTVSSLINNSNFARIGEQNIKDLQLILIK